MKNIVIIIYSNHIAFRVFSSIVFSFSEAKILSIAPLRLTFLTKLKGKRTTLKFGKLCGLSIVSLFLASNVFAQTATRELAEFSKLKISNALDVVLIQGNENRLVITATEEASIQYVKSEIKEGKLILTLEPKVTTKIKKNGNVKRKSVSHIKGGLKIILTFKHLNHIQQSGASDIIMPNVVKEEALTIKGSGAIEADLNLEVSKLTLDFSGASDMKLKGTATNFDLKMSGASDLKATNFIAKKIVINVSGASDITVNATESITGKATGASSITVKGNPPIKSINKSGVSSTLYGEKKSTDYYNGDDVTIKVGKQHLEVEDDDVDIKLGNKGVIVKDDGDTVRVKWGHTELVVIDDSVQLIRTPKKRRSHWAGIDLAINGFVNSKNSLDLSNDAATALEDVTQFMELNYAKSFSFSINFMEFYIPISTHHFGLVTGMGTEWSNYELKHNVKLNAEGGKFVHPNIDEFNKNYTWGEVDTVLDYSKNRFKTWFINAPLLLEINTGNDAKKSFHISAGVIFGFNLQTKMKYKYRLNGDNKKEKDKQSFNTNPFRVSATVRAGYGSFNMFAKYSLTPLFENGRGPELYPFTVGVTLLGF